ncbi:embryo defective 2410 [Prunus dulcis]|uniref:Embryo defective 2410 n=1 Tax=Prunus dulcis TaxID=3755 RepID=A0A4Y1QP34_PRUDU|nr:embryo defective 2410 [Prunus dulcis]
MSFRENMFCLARDIATPLEGKSYAGHYTPLNEVILEDIFQNLIFMGRFGSAEPSNLSVFWQLVHTAPRVVCTWKNMFIQKDNATIHADETFVRV